MTEDNFTKIDEKTGVETNLVVGAPVKITRARGGSKGKDTRVELIPKPDDGNWLDIELLNKPSTLHNTQTGYDRWVESTGRSLKKIEGTVSIENLAEALAHEDPLVQETANEKLREIKVGHIKTVFENEELDEEEKQQLKLQNTENSKISDSRGVRFDSIDISEEEKE